MESCWVLVQHNGIEIIMNEIDFDRFSDAQGKARLAKRFRCLEHWFDRDKAIKEHPKAIGLSQMLEGCVPWQP